MKLAGVQQSFHTPHLNCTKEPPRAWECAEAFRIVACSHECGVMVDKDSSKVEYIITLERLEGQHRRRGRQHFNNAIRQWKVAANAGSQDYLDPLMKASKKNKFPKEELTQVFQASNDEMKHKAREMVNCCAKSWISEK